MEETNETKPSRRAAGMIRVENSRSNRDNHLGDSSTSNSRNLDDKTMQTSSSPEGQKTDPLHRNHHGKTLFPPAGKTWSLPPNPLADRRKEKNSSPLRKKTTGLGTSKKASDSDNIVTAETTSTGRNSSSSSEGQDTHHATTTPASSGSGGKGRHSQHDNHHKRSWGYTTAKMSQSPTDDGSTLQVPGDDGSDRIVAGDIAGGVPIKPATVVASRLFPPHTSNTGNGSSLKESGGTGGKRESSSETSAQDQHHLLLPPHREPRYHTIRNTLYRFQGNDGNKHKHRSNRGKKRRRGGVDKKFSKTSSNTDPSSTDEIISKDIQSKKASKINHKHRGDHSGGSSSSTDTNISKSKRNGEPSRSNRSPAATPSTLARSEKSILQEGNPGGSSSGSGTDGTEDGYAGSVSSNENGSGNQQLGSSSPPSSETSSEECEQQEEGRRKAKRHRRHGNSKHKSSRGTSGNGEDPDSSSEIADFGSSGSSETMDEEDEGNGQRAGGTQTFGMKAYSSSPSLSSSNFSESDGLEMAYLSAKRDADAEHELMLKMISRKKKSKNAAMRGSLAKSLTSPHVTSSKRLTSKNLKDGRPPILAMGCDVMAHILTFLHPPEILDVLTMPLSKCWRRNFTSQPELWRVLCLVEPFKASIEDPISSSRSGKDRGSMDKDMATSSSDGTYCSIKPGKDKYRLLYTSFVRCMKYVAQIREDAINGRPPAYIDYGISGALSTPNATVNKTNNEGSSSPPPPSTLGSNRSLQLFLAQARNVVVNSSNNPDANNSAGESKTDDTPRGLTVFPTLSTAARVGTAHRKDEPRNKKKNKEKKNGPKFGRSMITSRLYGPVQGSEPSNLNLPWSCAIYSIVNWMVAFSDVEGLQTLCLKVLPVLLENEQHRLTAQHAGLADVVLRAMVMFSESPQLHIAAFHTIVLLARPHGGREGMMFRTSMTADGIFRGIYQRHGKSGIAVMLDSMRRFQDNATLLAMSCWALVNIALVSDQKAVLVKLGGIQAITNAMYRHPFSAELQFRALFALINLVIPSVQKLDSSGSDNHNGNGSGNNGERAGANAASVPSEPEQLGDLNDTTEKEIIDELVGDITSLVVHVMKNFCSSEAILNRACLVLHNLSLTDEYHVILLWTPQCYQMLEWCVANFRSDQVLQQSATGTLHRLQSTLASDDEMRARFSKSLQTHQQHVELVQREAR